VLNYLIRVQLPDRPGALGAVASRIGSVGGDVISFEILQRDNGVVVDELGVGLPGEGLIDLLREEILEVDGVFIESIRQVEGALPDRDSELLDVATELFKQTSATGLLEQLTIRVRRSLVAVFVAVMDTDTSDVVASAGDMPSAEQLVVMSRLAVEPLPATVGSDHLSSEVTDSFMAPEGLPVATADMVQAGLVLIVGRTDPVLRARERQWISIMAELADHGWRVFV
jgi:hypothetical protein